jgi:ketosteroid isomerase-like protein
MGGKEMKALVERYIEAYNAFDVEGMLALVDPGVEFKNVSNGAVTAEARGIGALRKLAEQSKTLFASRRQTMTSFKGSDDEAEVAVTFEAVLASDLPNGMRQGQQLRLEGRSEFSFRDGRILRIVDLS